MSSEPNVLQGNRFAKNISESDNLHHVMQTFFSLTATIFGLGNGMWGSAMFGSQYVLGGGNSYTYTSGQRNIKHNRKTFNVTEA